MILGKVKTIELKWSLMFLLAFAPVLAQSQTSLRRDVLEMTEMAERRVRQSVQDYLGPETRSIVNVYIKDEDPPAPVKPAQGSQGEANSDLANDSLWAITGSYLPAQIEQSVPGAGFMMNNETRVQSAEVVIQVEKQIDQARQKEIQSIATRILRGLKTKVSVKADLVPPVAKVEPESKREPASVETPNSLEEFMKRFGGLVPVLSAGVLFLGLMLLSLVLRLSAKDISDGMRSIRPSSASAPQTITLNSSPSTEKLPDEKNLRASLPPVPISALETRRGIQAIEKYILDMPLMFVRCLGDDDADLMGLKFLVSKVSEGAKSKLKEVLGTDRLIKASLFEGGDGVVGFNAGAWCQALIERIEIKNLAGGSIVEESLKPAESLLLSTVSEDDLFAAALKINEVPTWRIVTDFISSGYLKKRSKDIDDMTWRKLIQGSLIQDANEVLPAVQKLIESVRVASSEGPIVNKGLREAEEHFTRRILPSLVDALLLKDLGDDDQFIKDMMEEAPVFAKSIVEQVWTPSRLDDVENEHLSTLFNGPAFDNEKRAYLIFVLPAPYSERFKGFLPEGNSKRIVLDMLLKLSGTTDQKKRENMKALARDFLDYLRLQASSGAIPVKPREAVVNSSRSRTPAESDVEVVEDEDDLPQKKVS